MKNRIKNENIISRISRVFLTGFALFFIFSTISYAVTSAASINKKIAKAKATIVKQQALISKYQIKIFSTDPDKSWIIDNYNNQITNANNYIAEQRALISRLENGQVPTPTPDPNPNPTPDPNPNPTPDPNPNPTPDPNPNPTPATNLALQNITNYNLVLTHVTLLNATCNPACVPMTTLSPNAIQPYYFSDASGFIVFDYNVQNNSTNIGHLTITANNSGVILTNGLGGSVTKGSEFFQVSYVAPTAYWKGKFTDLANWATNNWNVTSKLPSWGLNDIEVRASQAGELSPKGDNYIRVHYPAGSANYGSAPPVGGAQFYGAMINTNSPVTFSFNMLLPTNFPFLSPTRGATVGKLPGLYGGIGNTGKNVPTGTDGWTTRFMWCDYDRASKQKFVGGGEVLQFTVNSDKTLYGTVNGTFLGCGVWKFLADGNWHNIQQTIHLNDVGKANGRIDVCIDGLPVFSQPNITFRTAESLQTNGILFQTFFGGGDSSYATPIDTYADFSDFALYLYPTTAAAGLCVTSP